MFESAKDFADYRLLEELWHLLRSSVGHYTVSGGPMEWGGWEFGWTPTQIDLERYIHENWGDLREVWKKHHPDGAEAWPPNWTDVQAFVLSPEIDPAEFLRAALDDVEKALESLMVKGGMPTRSRQRTTPGKLSHLSQLEGNKLSVYLEVEASRTPLQVGEIQARIAKRGDRGQPAVRTLERICSELAKQGVFENIPKQGYVLHRKLLPDATSPSDS